MIFKQTVIKMLRILTKGEDMEYLFFGVVIRVINMPVAHVTFSSFAVLRVGYG